MARSRTRKVAQRTGPNMNHALAIKVNAGHSGMGNLKRGWAIVSCENGALLDFVDEGYRGRGALQSAWPNAVEGPEFKVAGGEYRDLLRHGQED